MGEDADSQLAIIRAGLYRGKPRDTRIPVIRKAELSPMGYSEMSCGKIGDALPHFLAQFPWKLLYLTFEDAVKR